ncbi:hypothetical protein BGZ79_001715, partial [Entomortierella chlamydospora]
VETLQILTKTTNLDIEALDACREVVVEDVFTEERMAMTEAEIASSIATRIVFQTRKKRLSGMNIPTHGYDVVILHSEGNH